MKRLLSVKLCVFVMLLHGVACAQSRTLLAEGDYVALAKSGLKPLSHWKLWHLYDGKYEVIDANATTPSAIQVFRFDSKFMPIGFSKKTEALDLPDSRLPKFPTSEISCEYNTNELSCETVSGDGTRSTQTAAAVPPYVVIGEFYDLDFAWFMTGVVHLASSGQSSDGAVNVYAITTGRKPTEITLRPDKPIQIIPDGDESALALGRMQRIRKFEVRSDGRILEGTDQGLIVRLKVASNPELGYAIDNYREYEPWGMPFGHIAGVAASNATTPTSGSPVRIEVPSGVMIGLLARRVPPEYPIDAKLNKIEGKVVLHAVISKEGKVTEVSPISGPQELISAAVKAVKAWQYRPYVSRGQPVEVDTRIVVNFALPK